MKKTIKINLATFARYDLEGDVDSVCAFLQSHKKEGYDRIEFSLEALPWEDGYQYVVYGIRKENDEEEAQRIAKEKEEHNKQKERELAQLAALQKKYEKT